MNAAAVTFVDALGWESTPGASCEAVELEEMREDAVDGLRFQPARSSFVVKDVVEAWRDRTEMPLPVRLVRQAIDLAEALPAGTERPELAIDRDGDVAFEWMNDANDIVAVRLSSGGRLVYAVNVGNRAVSGTDSFRGSLPRELAEALQAFRD